MPRQLRVLPVLRHGRQVPLQETRQQRVPKPFRFDLDPRPVLLRR